jgi:phasin family protein
MFFNTERYTSMSKAFFESQLDAFTAVAGIALDGTEKTFTLNMAVARAASDDSLAAVQELLAAKDPQAILSVTTKFLKPNVDKISAYNQHLTEIASAARSEFTKCADTQVAEVQSNVWELVDTIEKNAPEGSEKAIASLKSVVAKGNEGYEKMTSAAKHAIEETDEHVSKASHKFADDVKKATTK